MTASDLSALRVGVVEDESRLRDLLVREITAMGYLGEGFPTAELAWPHICEGLDAVILDLNLPGMSGMELFRRIRSEDRDIAVVILTGFGAFESAVESIRWKAEDYLTKPCSLADIDRALSRVLARKQSRDRHHSIQQIDFANSDAQAPNEDQTLPHLLESKASTLADMERQRILDAMDRHGGNKPVVAAELGISLRTLYNRLNAYRHQGIVI